MNKINPGALLLPATKTSPVAIWSLVLGFLGILLLWVSIGPLFAIPAVDCGHVACARIKRSVGVLGGCGHGFGRIDPRLRQPWALGGLIPMLAAIAIPNLIMARSTAPINAGINDLRQIQAAKEQWALENKSTNSDPPTEQDVSSNLKGGFGSLKCPAGGTYTIKSVGEAPVCSRPADHLP